MQIRTDSLSSISTIESKKEENNLVQRILHRIYSLIEAGNSIVLTWLPSHVGISRNEVDKMAKEPAQQPEQLYPFLIGIGIRIFAGKLMRSGLLNGDEKPEI